MPSGKHSRRSRGVVLAVGVIALISLVTAACGGGRSGSSNDSSATTKPAAATDFGTMASPCGKGDAKGATQQGVTDTSITIGYGDDAG